jgi:hypothetical protein
MEKTGEIYVTTEEKHCVARWRSVDGSTDVFLCAVDLEAYKRHPHLRKMFVELATEVMLNRERRAGDSMTVRVREPVVETHSRWLL